MRRTATITTGIIGAAMFLTACAPSEGGGSKTSGNAKSDYPSKRLEVVVPYPAGGATDALARIWSSCLEKELGQRITVTNREGANGSVGTKFVAVAKPDGYTLEISSDSAYAAAPAQIKDAGYKTGDLDYIAALGYSPDVIYVNAKSPYKTIADLKAALDSGKALKVAAFNPGTSTRMRTDAVGKNNNWKWKPVPFQSAAEAPQSVVIGNTDIGHGDISIPLIEQVKAGRLRILAAGKDVSSAVDAVPTFEEAGVKGFQVNAQFVLLAGPQGLPTDVVQSLEKAVTTCRTSETVGKAFQAKLVPTEGTQGDALDKTIADLAPLYATAFEQSK